jgi:pimeloyl-ACP methyl ester carboxylesterase
MRIRTLMLLLALITLAVGCGDEAGDSFDNDGLNLLEPENQNQANQNQVDQNQANQTNQNPTNQNPTNQNHANQHLPEDEPALLGTYTHHYNEGPRTFDLVRLPRSDGEFAYIMWTPPQTPAQSGPLMVVAQPYDGIDWTGEEVDERWAELSPGGYPDVDGPDYDPATSGNIHYGLADLGEIADLGNIWLLNGMGLAFVFGRFYAGDALDGYVHSMVAALEFLGAQPRVDADRLGTFGLSWGGFMAVYGAAYAPDSVGPVRTAALFPPVDFVSFLEYATEGIEESFSGVALNIARAVFEPFVRRINAGVDGLGGPGFDGFRAEDICAQLEAPILVLHDEYDTLVPYDPVRQFADDCDQVEGVWYVHEEPIDFATRSINHGPILAGPGFPTALTFAITYLIQALNPGQPVRLVLYSEVAMVAFLETMHRLDEEDEDLAWAAERLIEMTTPGLTLIHLADFSASTGEEVLVDLINEIWELELEEADVVPWLADFL